MNEEKHSSHAADLQLVEGSHRAPVKWLAPTHCVYTQDISKSGQGDGDDSNGQGLSQRIEHPWRTRDQRKGRHPIRVYSTATPTAQRRRTRLRGFIRSLSLFVTRFPYYDISYLAALLFVIGSVLFIIDGFFEWLPIVAPQTQFQGESLYGTGFCTFVGAMLYEIGTIFIYLESVNSKGVQCFPWVLKNTAEHGEGDLAALVKPDPDQCVHHHSKTTRVVGKRKDGDAGAKKAWQWTWIPSWSEVKDHYSKQIGFLASTILLVGASLFVLLGFAALPGISNHLSHGETLGISTSPDLVGSVLFVISSYMFMLETQPNWYTPSLTTPGWWVGLCNTVGSFGFLWGAATAYCDQSWCSYQSSLATVWGSIIFLVGSIFQMYEALEKYPISYK